VHGCMHGAHGGLRVSGGFSVGFESGSGGPGVGSRVLGVGCWVLGLGCWVSGFGSWVLGLGFNKGRRPLGTELGIEGTVT
jgi:hypothetical protein